MSEGRRTFPSVDSRWCSRARARSHRPYGLCWRLCQCCCAIGLKSPENYVSRPVFIVSHWSVLETRDREWNFPNWAKFTPMSAQYSRTTFERVWQTSWVSKGEGREGEVGRLFSQLTLISWNPISDAICANNPRVVEDGRARRLANDLKRCGYYETCATYGLNVEKVFREGEAVRTYTWCRVFPCYICCSAFSLPEDNRPEAIRLVILSQYSVPHLIYIFDPEVLLSSTADSVSIEQQYQFADVQSAPTTTTSRSSPQSSCTDCVISPRPEFSWLSWVSTRFTRFRGPSSTQLSHNQANFWQCEYLIAHSKSIRSNAEWQCGCLRQCRLLPCTKQLVNPSCY